MKIGKKWHLDDFAVHCTIGLPSTAEPKVPTMNKLLFALIATLSLSALAQAPADTCDARAAEKKLAGAAKTSFLKKCERDAAAQAPGTAKEACEKTATEKKLAGAARNSFVTKCVKDAAAAK